MEELSLSFLKKSIELPKKEADIHPKGWGYENWIVNNELYCGKILFFEAGKKCSWHYHKIKDETFYIQSGSIMITYGNDDNINLARTITLNKGERFYVYPGLRHQMQAYEDTELIEFSTQHFEDDSYRVIKGD
jgi:mannose-6-phosphate isomerase-like protein (cupin superfamily)